MFKLTAMCLMMIIVFNVSLIAQETINDVISTKGIVTVSDEEGIEVYRLNTDEDSFIIVNSEMITEEFLGVTVLVSYVFEQDPSISTASIILKTIEKENTEEILLLPH